MDSDVGLDKDIGRTAGSVDTHLLFLSHAGVDSEPALRLARRLEDNNDAKAHGLNVVLIDTAGRMQTNKNLLEEMKKVARVAQPDLTVLVVDALTGNDAIEQGRIFSQAIKIDGVILTKLDADTKGGSAISMATVIGKPILFAAVGQNYKDLVSFNPDQIAAKITT